MTRKPFTELGILLPKLRQRCDKNSLLRINMAQVLPRAMAALRRRKLHLHWESMLPRRYLYPLCIHSARTRRF